MSLALVQSIKADLEARGVDLSGPCGAFAITKRVAWALRHEGWGLLGGKSPGQNGCTVGSQRYSVDWILKPSGVGRDVLEDAGGLNGPLWGDEKSADPDLWRPAIDPGDVQPPVPPVDPPPPQPPDPSLAVILAKLDALALDVGALHRRVADLAATPPPPYTGSAAIRYLGSAPITLTPTKG